MHGYDLVGITEVAPTAGALQQSNSGSLRMTRWKDEVGLLLLPVREQLKRTKCCSGLEEEQTRSSLVRVKEGLDRAAVVMGSCSRPPEQQGEADKALYRQVAAASQAQPWSFMGPHGGTAQQNLNNPGGFWGALIRIVESGYC